MKLHRFLSLALMTAGALAMSAQGTVFMPEGSTFQSALDKAGEEGKMVFLDCYTSWCGPCKKMSSTIFPMQEVGDFMNPKFVSIKIDMEKGEGPALASDLEISAYPTFVIFKNDGSEIARFVGSSDAGKFIGRINKALTDTTLSSMDSRFKAGERDRQFLFDYLSALNEVRRKKQCCAVAQILLEGHESTFASDTTLSKIFLKYINDPHAPIFLYAYNADNRPEIESALTRKKLDSNFKNVLRVYAGKGRRTDSDGNRYYDKDYLDEIISLLKANNVSGAEYFRQEFLLNNASAEKNWDAYVDCMNNIVTGADVEQNDILLCNWADIVIRNTTDSAILAKLKSTLKTRVADIKSGRRPEHYQDGAEAKSPQVDRMEKLIQTL